MTERIAYPMPSGDGYVLDPPINAHGSEYAHVTVARVADGDKFETIAYPAHGSTPLCWVDEWVDDDEFLGTWGWRVKRKPTTASGMVREFHETFGHPVANTPALIEDHRAQLRVDLIAEEFGELIQAINVGDLVGIADALADLKYVVEGAALEWGIPLDDCFTEVHQSNLSKLDENGQPIYHDTTNKILKGPNYWEPDLESILKNAGWHE